MSNINYPLSLSGINIGSIQLPNRIVFPAWQVNYANTDGTVSTKLADFYIRMADGGCGTIFTGAAVVSSDSVAFDRVMRIDNDNYIPGLKRLFGEIEKRNSIPAIQLIHYGRQALNSVTGSDLIAPSSIPCPIMSQFDPNYHVREMTLDDIERVYNDFINAAIRAAKAGAKVIEIHAAHGYLLNEFLSPYSNHRKDNYGGNYYNRSRLVVDIIKGVRNNLSKSIAISLRVSGKEFVTDGLVPLDFKEMIPLFQEAGIDMLNVSAGVYESMERIVPPVSLGSIPHIDIAAQLKEFTDVPVCIAGSIFNLDTAESILKSGKADLTAMGRAQVADPQIVKKSALGDEEGIVSCVQCNNCTFWTTGEPAMSCTVNSSL